MVMVTGSLLHAQRSLAAWFPPTYLACSWLPAAPWLLGPPSLSALRHPDYSTTPLWGFSTPSFNHLAIFCLLWPAIHSMPAWSGTTMLIAHYSPSWLFGGILLAGM